MDSSIIQLYYVKITSLEDRTIECAIFLVKINLCSETPAISHQPSELFKNEFLQVFLSLLASVEPILVQSWDGFPLALNQYYT